MPYLKLFCHERLFGMLIVSFDTYFNTDSWTTSTMEHCGGGQAVDRMWEIPCGTPSEDFISQFTLRQEMDGNPDSEAKRLLPSPFLSSQTDSSRFRSPHSDA